jgi:hypothetical protein
MSSRRSTVDPSGPNTMQQRLERASITLDDRGMRA